MMLTIGWWSRNLSDRLNQSTGQKQCVFLNSLLTFDPVSAEDAFEQRNGDRELEWNESDAYLEESYDDYWEESEGDVNNNGTDSEDT